MQEENQNQQRLRKAVSYDVSPEIDRHYKIESGIEEVKQVECRCCGLKEECTQAYIAQVEECYCGEWVCGLCSAAVTERLGRPPRVTVQDAVTSHWEFCRQYNTTTRLNPKLSLTLSMRGIAKRSSEKRNSEHLNVSKLARSTSYP